MSNSFFFIILSLGLGFFAAYLFFRPRKPEGETQTELFLKSLSELRQEMSQQQGQSRSELDRKLHELRQMVQEHQHQVQRNQQDQFKETSAIIERVTKQLTSVESTNKQVVNFAEQMKSLENILKNPKQRGVLGEYFLEALLSNVLSPEQYQTQYHMQNGEIVDAAIFYNDMIIPIDSKFSLEKYNRMVEETDSKKREEIEKAFKADVKKRIDETSKYVRPNEGTTDFAFMFIPAEGVYYNLLIYNVGTLNVNTEHLVEYAFRKKVIIVSPSSFFAYLETVLHGLKALKMEKSIQDILKNIALLSKHVNAYEDHMVRLGKHLTTSVNTYNQASREFKKIDKDIYKITEGESGGQIEPSPVEIFPQLED